MSNPIIPCDSRKGHGLLAQVRHGLERLFFLSAMLATGAGWSVGRRGERWIGSTSEYLKFNKKMALIGRHAIKSFIHIKH